jgi:hypothetical protein
MSLAAITSIWIEKGQRKKLVMSIYGAAIAFGCLLFVAGAVARMLDQPAYVVGPLMLSGIVITVVFVATLPVVVNGYAKAEQRKMLAKDM